MYRWLRRQYNGLLRRKKESYLKRLVALGLNLGNNVVIVDTFFFDPSHCFLISIGDNCTIAPGVRLIAHDASTKQFLGYTKIGRITIGKNCFLGDSVLVLPCVTIGDGAIIGASSVVTKDIAAGMVAAGNPARVLCPVADYLAGIEQKAARQTIFSREYYIGNLTRAKRDEVLKAVEQSVGFIV